VPRSYPLLRRFLSQLTLGRVILGIALFAVAFTTIAAALMRLVEPENYPTFGSAVWWSAQTVSTVGYGDNVPESGAGQTLAVVVMLFGIALVPAITSLVVAVFVQQQVRAIQERER
jgi:voltage-gated potassium channel